MSERLDTETNKRIHEGDEYIYEVKKKIRSEIRDEIGKDIIEALETDGAHHKQWYLVQIAKRLQIDDIHWPSIDQGIAP